MPKYVRVFPPREKVERDLREFMRRDLQLFFVWTGGLWDYNHRAQYESTFRSALRRENVRVEYLPDANHILTGLNHQAWLLREVSAWLSTFPRSGARPERSHTAA
jgi:hypothetical protein